MPIIKSSMALIGLVVWFFNFQPTATAASLSVLTVCERGQVGIVDANGRSHYIIDLVANVTDGYSDTTPIDPRLGDWNKPAIFGVIHDFEAQYGFKADGAFSWVGYGFSAYLTLSQVGALQRDLLVVMISEDSQLPLPLLPFPLKVDGTVVEYMNTADFPNAPGGHYFIPLILPSRPRLMRGERDILYAPDAAFPPGVSRRYAAFTAACRPAPIPISSQHRKSSVQSSRPYS